MPTDYGEKERAFLEELKETSGRELAEWMAAISEQNLPHRNDIIDWLRQQGFLFAQASWLERIHHNGGRPIYAEEPKTAELPEGPKEQAKILSFPAVRKEVVKAAAPPANSKENAEPEAPTTPVEPPQAEASANLDAILAKAKAYRPLAQLVIAKIKTRRPTAQFEARAAHVAIRDPEEFAALGISAKALRLHLALGDHPFDEIVKKPPPGAGLGRSSVLSHMIVLTDARQIDGRLLDLVAAAATRVNG